MKTGIDWAAIGKVGIPGVIALLFTYSTIQGFEKFDQRLGVIEQQHAHAAATAEAAKDLAGRALMTNERVLWVLQIMCSNDAKTNEARERCLRDMPR